MVQVSPCSGSAPAAFRRTVAAALVTWLSMVPAPLRSTAVIGAPALRVMSMLVAPATTALKPARSSIERARLATRPSSVLSMRIAPASAAAISPRVSVVASTLTR